MKQPEFGKKVALLRKEKGFTQEELAEMIHLSTRTIQRIEAGKGEPSHLSRCKLCDILEYPFKNEELVKISPWLGLLHFSASICFIPVPLFIWLLKRKSNHDINTHGRDVINFQITMTILIIGAAIFSGLISLAVMGEMRTRAWNQSTDFMPLIWLIVSILPLLALIAICLFKGISNSIKVMEGRAYAFPFFLNIL